MTKKRVYFLIIVIQIVFLLLTISKNIYFGLFYDDYLILENTLKSFQSSINIMKGFFRPLPFFLLYVVKTIGNFNVLAHVLNGLIGSLTTITATITVTRILSKKNEDPDRLSATQVLFIAILYVALTFHFSSTYNQMWISGIQTLCWGLFTVLSIVSFRQFLEREKAPFGINSGASLSAVYLMALMSYEASLSIPVILLTIYIYERGQLGLKKIRTRRVLPVLSGFIVFTFFYFIAKLIFPLPHPDPATWIRKAQSIPEFFVSLINPSIRPLFSFWIDHGMTPSPHDRAAIMMFVLGASVMLAMFLVGPILARDPRKQDGRYEITKKNWVFIALLFLSASPILIGRHAFSGRLAYGFIFPFAVALAYWARESKIQFKLALVSACIWAVFSVFSFIEYLHWAPSIGRFNKDWDRTIVGKAAFDGKDVIGLSYAYFYGYPAIVGPQVRLSYQFGFEPLYTGLICTSLDPHFDPSMQPIDELVAIRKTGDQRWLYTVRNERAYIHESNRFGKYSIGQKLNFPFGSVEIEGVNERGYISRFSLNLKAGFHLLDDGDIRR